MSTPGPGPVRDLQQLSPDTRRPGIRLTRTDGISALWLHPPGEKETTMPQASTSNGEPFGTAGPAPARSAAEQDLARNLLTLGFATDPIARWFWPDTAGYFRW